MTEPTVRRRADGSLELIEPEGCDDPVSVSLTLLRELVACQSIVSQLTDQVLRRKPVYFDPSCTPPDPAP